MKITAVNITIPQKKKLFKGMLAFSMFAGIAAGVIMMIADTNRSFLTNDFITQRLLYGAYSEKFFNEFFYSFFSLETILFFQMLSGFFAFGQPLSVFTLFHRGAAGGIAAALIYESHGIKGFIVILITLIPYMICNMYILILGATESIKFSNLIANYIIRKNHDKNLDLKIYFVKFLVLTVFAIICALVDGLLTFFFRSILF